MPESLNAWFLSVNMRPQMVCGFRLRPYSPSHAMFLAALRSPYISSRGDTATSEEFFVALGVCSRQHGENVAVYAGGEQPKAHVRLARKWSRRDLAQERAAFTAHLDDYATFPPLVAPPKGKRGLCAPSPYHLVRCLCSVYNVPLDEAWDFPLNLARCLYETDAEARGAKGLAYPADIITAELMAEERRLRAAGDAEAADLVDAQIRAHMQANPREVSQ